jgi:hypothetical protein
MVNISTVFICNLCTCEISRLIGYKYNTKLFKTTYNEVIAGI